MTTPPTALAGAPLAPTAATDPYRKGCLKAGLFPAFSLSGGRRDAMAPAPFRGPAGTLANGGFLISAAAVATADIPSAKAVGCVVEWNRRRHHMGFTRQKLRRVAGAVDRRAAAGSQAQGCQSSKDYGLHWDSPSPVGLVVRSERCDNAHTGVATASPDHKFGFKVAPDRRRPAIASSAANARSAAKVRSADPTVRGSCTPRPARYGSADTQIPHRPSAAAGEHACR